MTLLSLQPTYSKSRPLSGLSLSLCVVVSLLVLALSTPAQAASDVEPDPPTSITISQRQSQSVLISWTASAGATGYIVEVYTEGGTQVGIFQNVKAVQQRVGKTVLKSNKRYYVRIKSLNKDIGGKWSTPVYFRTRPAPVREFQMIGWNEAEAVFTWKKPRGVIDHYLVQIKRKGVIRRLIEVAEEDENNPVVQYTVTGLKPTRAYRFRARAVFDNGNKSEYTLSIKLPKRDCSVVEGSLVCVLLE